MLSVIKVVFILELTVSVFAQNDEMNNIIANSGSFLDGYELVTQAPLRSIEALPKCGEGVLQNRMVCVPYYNCDPNTNTVTSNPVVDGSTKIDIRFGESNPKCEHYLEVCCQVGNASTTTTTTTTRRPPTAVTTTQSPTSTGKTTLRPNSKNATCGIRNPQGIDFNFLGGTNEANFGEFPWMVAILRKNPASHETLAVCGGSLIGPRVILTGAHCVDNVQADNIKVRAGEWDTQTENERIPFQERNVARIILHESFISSAGNLYNDVALLILDRSFAKTDSVGTICLPEQNQVFNTKDCFATGWGKTTFGEQGRYAVILKKIQLPTVSHQKCQDALRTTRLGVSFILHRSFMCAGGEGLDTCTGDGGSPLVCRDPNNPRRYLQAGIVAWGIGCRDPKVPGVYADVSKFRQWIDLKLQEIGININSYIL